MKKILWRRILPILMTAVMLFSAIVPTMAASVSAPDEEEPYYTIEFEEGVLTVKLNAEKVYKLLRDGKLSREDLLNFIPEDVLATLEKGRDITVDDLTELASEYVTAEELRRLRDIIPTDIFRKYFDISMLDGIVELDEILSLIPVDEIMGELDESKIKELINEEAWKLLLNDAVKEKILTPEFIAELLGKKGIVDELLAKEETRAALIGLIDSEVVAELIRKDGVTEALINIIDSSVVTELIKTDGVTEQLVDLIDDKVVSELIKKDGVTDAVVGLIDSSVITELIKTDGVTQKLIYLIDDKVVSELLKADGVIDAVVDLIDGEVIHKVTEDREVLDALSQIIVDDPNIAHAIVEMPGMQDKLCDLVDEELIDKVFNDPVAGPNLIALTESPEFLANLLADENEAELEKVKVYLAEHKQNVSNLLGIDGVVHAIKPLSSVQGFLAETVSISEIDADVLDTDKFVDYATDAQVGFITEDDLKQKILNDDDHLGLDTVEYPLGTPAEQYDTMQRLEGKSASEIIALLDMAQLYAAYRSSVSVEELLARDIVNEDTIKDLVVKHWAEMLGGDEQHQHDSNELIREVLGAVGLPTLFEAFNRDQIVQELGGYAEIFHKGLITSQQIVEAVGGYDALVGFLIPEHESELIEKIGYQPFLELLLPTHKDDIIAAAKGYGNIVNAMIAVGKQGALVGAVGGYGSIANAIIAAGKQGDLVGAVGGYGSVANAIIAAGKQDALVTAVGGYGAVANAIIVAGKQDALVTAVGGYGSIANAIIAAGKQGALVEAVGGYEAILDALLPEKQDDIVRIVGGYGKLAEFVELGDIVAKAGGSYASLLGWYTPAELGAIVKAIGAEEIIKFARDNGIIDKLDVKGILSDVLDLVRSKKNGIKSLTKTILTRLSNIFLIEVQKAYLNGKQICSYGTVDLQATVTALLQAIPDTDDVLGMQSGDTLASLMLTVLLKDREPITVGVRFVLIGDLEDLQDIVRAHADEFRFDVSDDMDIETDVAVPSVAASLYERALLSDRLPDRLKTKILEIPTMTVADVSVLLSEITDDEIAAYADDVLSRIDTIRDKAYAKIDARFGDDNTKIELAKKKVDEILEKVSNTEKLSALRDKAVEYIDRIAARLGDKKISDFYSGESVFELYREIDIDFYDILSKKITVPEKLYLFFDNDMSISGSFELSLKVKDLYRITVIEENGEIREFFLTEGMPLAMLNERAGVAYEFEDGALVEDRDMTFVHENVFVLEFYGRDGALVQRFTYTEGEAPLPSEYPSIPARSGYTSEWVLEDIGNNTTKATVKDTAIEYKLKYEYGGQLVELGTPVTVETRSIRLPIPEKIGYTFDTWLVDFNGDGEYDEEDGDFRLIRRIALNSLRPVGAGQPTLYDFDLPDGKSFPAGEVKLLSAFDINKYTVEFINKGQVYGESEFDVEDMTVALPDTDPTADAGYAFDGWFLDTDDDGDGDRKLIAGSVAPALRDYSAYSAYRAIEYKATFSNGDIRYFTIEDDVIANIPAVPALDGYTGGRWMVDVGDDDDASNDILLAEYVISVGDITVYAQYDIITYTVTFMSKGQQYATDTFDVTDRTVTRPATDPTADTGYRFVGWFVDTDGDGDGDVALTSAYRPPLSNITVYAVFESTTYSATFEAVPGTSFGGMTIYFEYGDTELVGVPTVPQKVGYSTDGKWYVRTSGGDVALDRFDLSSATSNIRLYAKYTPIQYNAKYEYGEQIRDLGTVTVETRYVWLPIPERVGYTFDTWYVDIDGDGKYNESRGDFKLTRGISGANSLVQYTLPSGKAFPAADVIIRAIFNVNTYTATFSDGTVLRFTVLDDELTGIPAVPAREGYIGAWYVELGDVDVPLGEYELGATNITVYAKYEPIKYKATFVVGDEIIATLEFTVEDEVIPNIPEVPEKLGYTGKWEKYTIGPADITVRAIYVPIIYTATFIVDGNVFHVMNFTVEDTSLYGMPAVPEKLGYTGVWSSYTLGAGNITIEAIYTINVYKATFVADGVTVAVVEFTVNDTAIAEPEVPAKAGYIGAWEEYTLGASDIVINAVYTAEPVEPQESIIKRFMWLWIIIIVLLIIIGILIFLLINRKRDDDEPEPPVTVPVVEPEPEPQPEPEEIHIDVVESVDVAMADELMSDEVASHVVETVYGAGVGMKAIINVQDINDMFAPGDTVDIDALKQKKLIPAKAQRIKVLADGHLDKPLTVIAEAFSVQAVKMITLTGGKVIQKK